MDDDPFAAAVARVERAIGIPELAERLAQLRRSELTTLLMAVAKARLARTDALALARSYDDPFVAPSSIDPRAALELDRVAYALAERFTPLELSPLAPLGACAALAPVDQNRIEGTARGREVASDPSNVLALEAARRRKGGQRVDLCASLRVVRTPPIPKLPGFAQHFRLFALVSAFRGHAVDVLSDHLAVHVGLLAHIGARSVRVTLVNRTGKRLDAWRAHLAKLAAQHTFDVVTTTERAGAETYYPTLSFTIDARIGPHALSVADGGLVDWTARLLSDRKERCVISGIGTERLLWARLAQ